jgi:hypothetical protein
LIDINLYPTPSSNSLFDRPVKVIASTDSFFESFVQVEAYPNSLFERFCEMLDFISYFFTPPT